MTNKEIVKEMKKMVSICGSATIKIDGKWVTIAQLKKEDVEQIERDLEVLEIIKTKKVDMNHLWSLFKWDDDESALAEYNKYNVEQYELTEAEFKLLKDAL